MFHSDDNEQSHCHDTVSRLVVCCRCVVTGYFYILDNFVSYREPYLIGPFECAVYARIDVARLEVPVLVNLVCRERTRQCIVGVRSVSSSCVAGS